MNGRTLDTSNDIFLEGTAIARNRSKSTTTAQRVRTMLRTFMGEAYADRFHGIPWFQEILGGDELNIPYARTVLKEKILETPGVKEVLNLSISLSGRALSGSFQIRCDDGSAQSGEF
jgi:hypothetical protein